jgi:acyl-CoA synthetase (AMP-forming)/AMP-acid ligase II
VAAPNFAYELCLNKLSDAELEGLDLSSWRLAFNGAEPISPDTVERFASRFGRYGFRREAMFTVYGLAEGVLGVTFPPLEREPLIDRVSRAALMLDGTAKPATAEDVHAVRFVSSRAAARTRSARRQCGGMNCPNARRVGFSSRPVGDQGLLQESLGQLRSVRRRLAEYRRPGLFRCRGAVSNRSRKGHHRPPRGQHSSRGVRG